MSEEDGKVLTFSIPYCPECLVFDGQIISPCPACEKRMREESKRKMRELGRKAREDYEAAILAALLSM
jgi:hypothetical protein